jgi:DNA primase
VLPDETIAEVRDRTDIVALVGEYVRLARTGASFKGLCPFHSEKTPSFHVTPARRFFHCFGCGVSGDAIAFVMKIEGRSFPEAVRLLAERAGVQLPAEDSREVDEHRRARQKRERLGALMEAAAGFYRRMLAEHPLGSMARDELARRGVTEASAAAFRLGYAPAGWDTLGAFLAREGWSPAEAEEVGLLVQRRGGGHYDRFRHRLVFPIADLHGTIVAFSGRLLPPAPGEAAPPDGEAGAKYINSPESPLYRKGEVLFGLHQGRVSIRRQGVALLCEGNFDLVMLHQAGFDVAVAPMGTALTLSQARLLRRFAERVVLLFDGDVAGRKAVRAAQPVLREAGLSAAVVTLPPGEDPDSFLRHRGSEALRALIDAAPGIVEHLIDEAADAAAGDAAARARAVAGLGPLLATIDNAVERGLYVERVAQRFGIPDVASVRQALRQGVREARRSEPRPRAGPRGGSTGDTEAAPREAQDGPGPGNAGLVRFPEPGRCSSGHRWGVEPSPGRPVPQRTPPPLEAQLLGALLDVPAWLTDGRVDALEELLTQEELRAMVRVARDSVQRDRVDAAAFIAALGDHPYRAWVEARLALHEHDADSAKRVVEDAMKRLRLARLQAELADVKREVLRARRAGDHEAAELALRRVDELHAEISEAQGVRRAARAAAR